MEEKQLQLGFKFESFKISKYEYYEPDLSTFNKNNPEYNFHFKSEINVTPLKESISVLLNIEVTTKTKEPEKVGIFEVRYNFSVVSFKNLMVNEREYRVPIQFFAALISLSLSTTRGMMLMKFSDTALDSVIMPIINPHELIPKEWLKPRKVDATSKENRPIQHAEKSDANNKKPYKTKKIKT